VREEKERECPVSKGGITIEGLGETYRVLVGGQSADIADEDRVTKDLNDQNNKRCEIIRKQ